MPRNKGRRGEASGDWEAGGTEESYVNGSDSNISSNRAGPSGGGENGDDIDNNRMNNSLGSGRRRQNRGGDSTQHRSKHDLGLWAEAVNDTVRSMGAASQAIKDLQGRFESHADDLRAMEETKETLRRLEELCREKDKDIQRHEATITTLTGMSQRTEEMTKNQKEKIELERQELEQEKAKLEKRVTTTIAEERVKLRKEFDKLVTEHGQSHDKRKKELEDELSAKMEENNRRVTDLENENRRLSTTAEKLRVKVDDQAKKLNEVGEQCYVLERAKDSIKRDLLDRENELDMQKREFALSSKSKEHFKQKFAEIYKAIEDISLKYFSSLDREDLEKVHEELVAADPCFASVPVDDTDDSLNLRIAHAQRIMSDVIYEYIWKPFRSDFTLLHPNFDDLLFKISGELEKSSHGGRAAIVWTALTTRALQSFPADLVLARAPDIKEPFRPTNFGRAERVVSKVLSILSPLVSSSQYEDLRVDLLNLTKPAIDIWNDAQTGELKVTVSPLLKIEHREEWRYQKLDPVTQDNDDKARSDIMSKTHPRIFTLFPRVMAWEVAGPVKPDAVPPGSWPLESDQGPRRIETCIHPGVGLPEWSSLVVRGKEDQEERNEYILKALEKAKKELHSSRRQAGHGRRDSTGSAISVPSSPSQLWRMGGVVNSHGSDL